jgi:transposase
MAHGLKITRTDASAKKLRAIASRTEDGDVARRLLAIALAIEGMDRASAARICGMDRQTLRDWVHRYNAEGVAGLSNRLAPGAARRLDAEQMRAFAALVEHGPDIETDGVVRWRCVDLVRKIKEKFGVDYHERSVGKLLAAIGYVRISVRPQHPKSDPEVQEVFKKLSQRRSASNSPRRRAASRLRSGSRTRPEWVSRAH